MASRWQNGCGSTTKKMQDFDAFAKQAEQKLGYPMFVKPANAGSSAGVGKAHDRAELKSACLHALQERLQSGGRGMHRDAGGGNRCFWATAIDRRQVWSASWYRWWNFTPTKPNILTAPLHCTSRAGWMRRFRSSCAAPQKRRLLPLAAGLCTHRLFCAQGRPCGHPQRNQHHPGLYLHQHVPEAVGTLRAFLSAAAGPPDSAGTGAQRTITKPKEGTRRLWITGQSGCLIRDWGA